MRQYALRLCVSNRTLWAVVMVLCLLLAIGMVWIEWSRNDTSPTLIALDTSHYPIWNIDFPAVTLCGINRIQKSRALTLSNEWYERIIISL
jgi:Amiloride-sensitive sodium channel.